MKILAGAYQADSGDIIFKGKKRGYASTGDIIDSGISIIYQELALVPEMSVAENIFLGREPRLAFGILNPKELYQRSAALLERPWRLAGFALAGERIDHCPATAG